MENIILFIIVLFIPCIAYSIISTTYSKYRETKIKSKLSGFEVARKILDDNDLKDMYIVEVKGNLNDHYDFKQKVIRLSTDIYHGDDVTAVAVASKVCSYAIQDKENNSFMKFNFTFNPLINFDIYISYLLFIIGICFQDFGLIKTAFILMLVALAFYIVVLPVQFDATKKADNLLKGLDVLEESEIECSTKVLKVSALSFIMSILTCISNLFNEILYNLKII